MLRALPRLWPPGVHGEVLFDRGAASQRGRPCGRRRDWQVLCASKSQPTLDDQKRSPGPQALRQQRDQRGPRTAPGGRPRTALGRTLPGNRPQLPFAVCGLRRQRHHRAPHPQAVLGTDRSFSAQPSQPISQKRWPIAVDNFSGTPPVGLADWRVQSSAATAKWCALVVVAWAFWPWRLHHAQAEERWRAVADVVRHHRDAPA